MTHFSYCETDFVRRCLSYARKLEMKVKNASVMSDQTEHTFLGQNFLNSPVCFPVAVLWLSVSEWGAAQVIEEFWFCKQPLLLIATP